MVEEKKQAAADVLFHYSTFVMACLANQVSPSNLRLHLMKVMQMFKLNFVMKIISDYNGFFFLLAPYDLENGKIF
ncbi:hypothetical protein U1Q18_011538 [Sarracenia purpurea var. burkii]